MDGAHHHDLPAGLAVADQARLALGVWMPPGDLLDKAGLRHANVLNRLTGHRIRQKADKVAGMAGGERHPDLAVLLHAADARAVPGTRVENDERPLVRVEGDALWWDDAYQSVIHRPRQCPAVEHHLDFEAEDVRCLAGIVLCTIIAALPQHIEQQNSTLPSVDRVV
jgi:hypothetical protein